MITLSLELFRVYIPKGLTFGEAFALFSVIAHYTCFTLENCFMSKRAMFFVGNNAYNAFIFAPVSVVFQ